MQRPRFQKELRLSVEREGGQRSCSSRSPSADRAAGPALQAQKPTEGFRLFVRSVGRRALSGGAA